MYSGYLSVELHPDRPGEVRIRADSSEPAVTDTPPSHAPRIIYTARFSDLDAARMHAHQALHNHLLDIDDGRYRAEPVAIIAALEAESLNHERIYIDPQLEREISGRLESRVDRILWLRAIKNRIWSIVGAIAIALLIFNLLFNRPVPY